tara:strand:+ start:2387 stop:2554 length:168 start_codon:yes stop_codon:yes gene_type:complete
MKQTDRTAGKRSRLAGNAKHARKMLPDITSTPQMKIRHQSLTDDEPSGQNSSAGY